MEIEEIISVIENSDHISIDDSFSFARVASVFLRNNEEKGRRVIIYVLDNWNKFPNETIEIWTDLIESAGFYPYLEKLKNETDHFKFDNLAGEIRKESHFSENLGEKYFHEEQKILKEILESGRNLIVSAPTSFGKSLLIEETVASTRFKNIIVIQPTLALLDETRKKLKKYKDKYKIIVRTSQEPSEEKGNLFLLTAERVMEYQNLPQIDFFVIDEFYKLSAQRDDERSDVLNNAFYKLLQQAPAPQFYLLGPNIDGISEGFAKKYNAIFYKTNYSLIGVKGLKGKMMFLNSSYHSYLVEEFLHSEGIKYQKEVNLWSSRIDFYLPDEDRFVEVKGCSLFEQRWSKRVGLFPDAPTARWAKHLRELLKALKQGHKASVWFLLMSEIDELQINSYTDPNFAKAFEEFLETGGDVRLLNVDFFKI